MKTALYVGSFDPPTNGHTWVIEQASLLFDEVVVAVGTNPSKTPFFTEEDRLSLLRSCTSSIPNVEIQSFPHSYTVSHAAKINATHLVRGLRSSADFETERTIQLMNSDIARLLNLATPTPVFLMPPKELAEISSSLIKQLIGPKSHPFAQWGNVVASYVPGPVLAYLRTYCQL